MDQEPSPMKFPPRKAPKTGEVVSAGLQRRGPDDDADMPNPADVQRLNDNVTKRCSSCKKEIYDDAEVCYHCGDAVVSGSARGPRPWVVVVIVVVIAAFLFSFIGRLF
ncbi:MAG: hypothetical protein K2X32_14395 [Phycisphaerales bacterium]|nr:hypothetical protein [Phycisphaerales bacterium]